MGRADAGDAGPADGHDAGWGLAHLMLMMLVRLGTVPADAHDANLPLVYRKGKAG